MKIVKGLLMMIIGLIILFTIGDSSSPFILRVIGGGFLGLGIDSFRKKSPKVIDKEDNVDLPVA